MYMTFLYNKLYKPIQRTKKVVSNTPGLVDFYIRLLNSVLTELTGTSEVFWGYSNNYYRSLTIIKPAQQNIFFRATNELILPCTIEQKYKNG